MERKGTPYGTKNLTHIFRPPLWHDPRRLCAGPPGQPCYHTAPRRGFRSRRASAAAWASYACSGTTARSSGQTAAESPSHHGKTLSSDCETCEREAFFQQISGGVYMPVFLKMLILRVFFLWFVSDPLDLKICREQQGCRIHARQKVKGHHPSDECWNPFKGNGRDTSEKQGGVRNYVLFPSTIPSWTELTEQQQWQQ